MFLRYFFKTLKMRTELNHKINKFLFEIDTTFSQGGGLFQRS